MAQFLDKQLSTEVHQKYISLPVDPNVCLLTYIWIDGTGENLRSKVKTSDFVPKTVADVPQWYEGDYKVELPERSSEVCDFTLKPVAMYKDPFLGGNNKLVMCSLYYPDGSKSPTNFRDACIEALEQVKHLKPWFGFEQEFAILDRDFHPYGWPKGGIPPEFGNYFCTIGSEKVIGRRFSEAHYIACLYAGVRVCGSMAEGFPAQWEYQVGICEGVSGADELWISRYIMHRLSEEFGVVTTLDPKPIKNAPTWGGSGCHTNFSTSKMRVKEGGMEEIWKAVEKLKPKHEEHLAAYGSGNEKRLIGKAFASSMHEFTAALDSRAGSIRIPDVVCKAGCGYLEDRRPSSNCDPYRVINVIIRTTLLNETTHEY